MASTFRSFRFELYEGLVSCHLEQHKSKEARMAANYCIKQIGQNARTITLYASVLSRDQATLAEAQKILEKAVNAAPYLLKAVYLLVDIYDKQGNYGRAVDLLRRQTSTHVKHRLHRLLGDFLSKADRPAEAMDSYRYGLWFLWIGLANGVDRMLSTRLVIELDRLLLFQIRPVPRTRRFSS